MKFLIFAVMALSMNVQAQNFGLDCEGKIGGVTPLKIEAVSPYVGSMYEDQGQLLLTISPQGQNPLFFLDEQIKFTTIEGPQIGLEAKSKIGEFKIDLVISADGFEAEGKTSLKLNTPYNIYSSEFTNVDVVCQL